MQECLGCFKVDLLLASVLIAGLLLCRHTSSCWAHKYLSDEQHFQRRTSRVLLLAARRALAAPVLLGFLPLFQSRVLQETLSANSMISIVGKASLQMLARRQM